MRLKKRGVFSTRDIIGQAFAFSPPKVAGLYFLIADGEIVYIGRSTDVWVRINEHRQKGKAFERVSVYECEEEIAKPMEAAYIAMLKPRLNLMQDFWHENRREFMVGNGPLNRRMAKQRGFIRKSDLQA